MSTVDPFTLRLHDTTTGVTARLRETGGRLSTALRATAFWTAIPLPLLIFGTLVTGLVASMPLLVAGLALLNVCCAVFGHNYSPDI